MCPAPWLPVSVELTTGVIGGEYEDTKSVEHCFMLSKTINVPGAANCLLSTQTLQATWFMKR